MLLSFDIGRRFNSASPLESDLPFVIEVCIQITFVYFSISLLLLQAARQGIGLQGDENIAKSPIIDAHQGAEQPQAAAEPSGFQAFAFPARQLQATMPLSGKVCFLQLFRPSAARTCLSSIAISAPANL